MGALFKRLWATLPDNLEGGRQLGVLVMIFFLIVCHKVMVGILCLCAFLGILWLIRARGAIVWRHLWPLGLSVLFFVLMLVNIPRSPSLVAMHAIDRNLPWVLVPLALVGLKPSRGWGQAWLWGTVFSMTFMLVLALLDAVYVAWSYDVFFYERFTQNMGVGCLFFSVCCAVSLLLSVEYCYGARRRLVRLGYGVLSLYMLLGVMLSSNRSTMIALCAMVLVFVVNIVCSKRMSRDQTYVVSSVAVLCALLAVAVVRHTRTARLVENPRLAMWEYTLAERAAYMPWGLGTLSQDTFIAEELYTKHRDCQAFQRTLLCMFNNTHSTYLDTLVQYGVPGLLYFLFLLAVPWFAPQCHRQRHRQILALVAVVLIFNSLYQSSEFARLFSVLINLPLAYMAAYKQYPAAQAT